jgi:mRNA interferase RelE/StbE
VTYRIVITPTALRLLAGISDRRIQQAIRDRIDGLAHDPEQQGHPLGAEFTGYRSGRAVGQRYRIIYRVERQQALVAVVVVGLRKEGDRKDVYAIAKRLLRLRLL